MEPLGGIILAAGLSSRMGRYKPLIEVQGRSMIGHVIDRMRTAGASPIVVVTGHRAQELRAQLAGEPVEFVYNPDYAHTQQLESLRLGLRALKGRCVRVLISPADVPAVRQETVSRLLAMEGDFIRPVYHGEVGHPVVLHAALIPYLMAYDGPGGLRGAIERSDYTLRELLVEDRGTVLDNDTPQDIERLLTWCRDEESGHKN